jgi:tripartite-type tricarboxylate transporter receptor subunit TctC
MDMNKVIRAGIKILLALTPILLSANYSWAAYPDKPIVYVAPYLAGGTNDGLARLIAKQLGAKLGQSVIVENRAGAGGTIGAGYVANSKPDGYTLLNASVTNLATAPQLIKANFDPFKDFVSIAHIGGSRSVIAVNPNLPITTFAGLIDYAKKNPGKLTYGSSGNGSPGNITMEYIKLLSGIDIRHVPYKGSSQALTDAMGGTVDLVCDPLANTFVKSGKLRALAFLGSPEAPDLPGIPSLKKFYPQWNFSGSFVVVAPSKTPPEVVNLLRQTFNEILKDPEVIKAINDLGVSPGIMTTAETDDLIKGTYLTSQKIIEKAKISAE